MYESLWKVSFGIFLIILPLAMAQAIIRLALQKVEKESPRWLLWFGRTVNLFMVVGFIVLTATIASKWEEAGYPPFSNMPESLLWMAWGSCAVYFVCRLRFDFAGLEVGGCVGVLGILALSCLFDHSPRPLMPALQSNWLIFHVLTCMVSYGAFLAAFCMSLLWLIVWRKRESGKLADALAYQTMTFGFLLLTVGIVSGSVWAQQAWGRYWGWDNKETWSLITWFVYGIYIHVRLAAGSLKIPRESLPLLNAVFAVLGFAFSMFTYFGVSYLLPSLHSYMSR